VELPLGPCVTFRSPGGQWIGLYELTRPEVDELFAGRADFELSQVRSELTLGAAFRAG
jgi:hypothetical protein